MPMREAPSASAACAAATQASVPIQPWQSQSVECRALWAHHLQSSPHRPCRALTMAQKSKTRGAKRRVIAWAASRNARRGALRI